MKFKPTSGSILQFCISLLFFVGAAYYTLFQVNNIFFSWLVVILSLRLTIYRDLDCLFVKYLVKQQDNNLYLCFAGFKFKLSLDNSMVCLEEVFEFKRSVNSKSLCLVLYRDKNKMLGGVKNKIKLIMEPSESQLIECRKYCNKVNLKFIELC